MSFLVLPASTNYKIEGFSFGNAGGGMGTSPNFGMQANVGELAGKSVGNSYDLGAGLAWVRQANVPTISMDNPANYYNKLHITIGIQDNPSDTRFAVAISKDNWATTQFVKSDLSVGSSLTMADYLTYQQWGAAGGVNIVGLEPGTSYKVKAKAIQGMYTETDFGPEASAATENPTLVFDIDVAATDIQTTPPYLLSLDDLIPGDVVTSSEKVWISLETNATAGGSVFVYGQNGGLYSLSAGYTIPAVSGDLGVLSNGFGAQGVGVTQTGGGPLLLDDNFNLAGNSVGLVDTLVRQAFKSAGPLVGGRGSLLIKAKSDNNAPAAGDYSEILTVIGAANF